MQTQSRSLTASDRSSRQRVVVIVGASSGIGRATAITFARLGAHVVVAARRDAALAEVVRECIRLGAQALAVPTDITSPEQVEELAKAAIERFGRIDVWVNNAAVLMMGRFDEVPLSAFHRVMATNFFGRVYCTRAVLKHFKSRGTGLIIDVNSVLGRVAQPYASSYVASKFAARGFNQSLREELLDTPGIQVCSIFPAPVDTPIYASAANFMGRQIRPMWPVYDAFTIAEQIVELVRRPKPEAFAGQIGSLITLVSTLLPLSLVERLVRATIDFVQVSKSERAPTLGNLMHPERLSGAVSGDWRSRQKKFTQKAAAGLLLGLSLGVACSGGLRRRGLRNRPLIRSQRDHRTQHTHRSSARYE